MWLMSYMTKNSIAPPNAVKGDVQGNDGSSVVSSGEHKNLPICAPYGVLSIPPAGERAVVLPLDDGEVSIGSVCSPLRKTSARAKLCCVRAAELRSYSRTTARC